MYRHLVVPHAVDLVGHADRDLLQAGQHVELGQEEVGQAVDPGRVAGDDRVEPAAAAVPAGGDAALAADLAQGLAELVEQLGRERAGADAGRVGLEDADHPVDLRRADAGARARAARGRVGRGDERIGAVVDVEQRALAALEQTTLPSSSAWLSTSEVSATYGASCSA